MPASQRSTWRTLFVLLFALTASLIAISSTAAAPQQVGHVAAELISESASIQPGQPFTLGLRLTMDEHWHVYWRNAGDAGLPVKIRWTLPEGFTAGEIQWPIPEHILFGTLVNYGYHGEVLLPVTITPPADLSPGEQITIAAHGEWLVCKEACIPGEADFSIALPVTTGTPGLNESTAALFSETRDRMPLTNAGWDVGATLVDHSIEFTFAPPEWFEGELAAATFFPYDKNLIKHAGEQTFETIESGYQLTVPRSNLSVDDPTTIEGLLVSESGWRGPGSESAIEISVAVGEPARATATNSAASTAGTVWQAILFAFIGGMILNLMPCVLPVLSLKIMGFVQQANESRSKAMSHGLIFTLGVLISFWVLAGVLQILRAGGNELGWGFQLQSPMFLMVLSAFMFLFGLNLLGVFEIGTSLTAVGGASAGKTGWGGSFLNGVTATIVATPCTAPFMGSALGFSLSQPAYVSWLVFTALGLGMAFPYVVLSASPALLKFIPKPGRWMESLKQVMGFILLATIIWLSWVLGQQAGSIAVTILLGMLLLLGAGAWVLGRWGTFSAKGRTKAIAYTVTVLLVIGGLGAGLMGVDAFAAAPSVSSEDGGEFGWQEFSPEKVESLRSDGTPVFIDFTAAWCLSCQVNERVAFGSSEVRERFDELGVVALKADWTSRDDMITRALASFGRNSVPLYVLYPGDGRQPIILPEILTPGIVLEALNQITSQGDRRLADRSGTTSL